MDRGAWRAVGSQKSQTLLSDSTTTAFFLKLFFDDSKSIQSVSKSVSAYTSVLFVCLFFKQFTSKFLDSKNEIVFFLK